MIYSGIDGKVNSPMLTLFNLIKALKAALLIFFRGKRITATSNLDSTLSHSSMWLAGFSEATHKFQPLFKGSAGLKVLPSTISSSCSFNSDKKETEKTNGGSSSTSQCDGLQGGEGFRDYSQGGCQSGRGGDETLQDSGHVGLSRWLSQDCSKSMPLRTRKVLVMCTLFSDIYCVACV